MFQKPYPSPSCQSNIDCSPAQLCHLGSCFEISCSSDLNCPNNAQCVNSYCHPLSCNIGNDCPTGSSCISGSCINVGTVCSSNSDCPPQLSCFNNVCIQCILNSTCPSGQGCFNQSCRFPFPDETKPNMVTYLSPSQSNGNVLAPPAYLCPSSSCGLNSTDIPISCSSSTSCPSSCPFCLNNYCRCTQGDLYEYCSSDSDCLSGLCSQTSIGKICSFPGGDCSFNYDPNVSNSSLGYCPISNPYCVNGKCSPVSLGAICGGSSLPHDICSNPSSLGISSISLDGMGFFCVNGICQNTPGPLNSLCSNDSSCMFFQHYSFVCSLSHNGQSRCISPN